MAIILHNSCWYLKLYFFVTSNSEFTNIYSYGFVIVDAQLPGLVSRVKSPRVRLVPIIVKKERPINNSILWTIKGNKIDILIVTKRKFYK